MSDKGRTSDIEMAQILDDQTLKEFPKRERVDGLKILRDVAMRVIAKLAPTISCAVDPPLDDQTLQAKSSESTERSKSLSLETTTPSSPENKQKDHSRRFISVLKELRSHFGEVQLKDPEKYSCLNLIADIGSEFTSLEIGAPQTESDSSKSETPLKEISAPQTDETSVEKLKKLSLGQ